jgi:hypothetical protein
MASLLPFLVIFDKRGIRLSRSLRSPEGYGSLIVVFLLALGWWLPNQLAKPVIGTLAAIISATLAVRRIKRSSDLTPKAQRWLTVLILLLTLTAAGLSWLFPNATEHDKHVP